jgi:hypothetical protein
VTADPHETRDPGGSRSLTRAEAADPPPWPDDDPSIVPGLGEPGELPAPRTEATPPTHLDPAGDPDRYDPGRASAPIGPLDPALDPDRHPAPREVPPGQGQTLTELLGEGAHEEKRDGYEWVFGLIGILAFLALTSWFFTSVATP